MYFVSIDEIFEGLTKNKQLNLGLKQWLCFHREYAGIAHGGFYHEYDYREDDDGNPLISLSYEDFKSARTFNQSWSWVTKKKFVSFCTHIVNEVLMNMEMNGSNVLVYIFPKPCGNNIKIRPKKKSGYIYVLESDHGYKIGKTKNKRSRFKSLNIQLPFELKEHSSYLVEDYDAKELELHEHFKEKRLNGEWFDLSECDLSDIPVLLGVVE